MIHQREFIKDSCAICLEPLTAADVPVPEGVTSSDRLISNDRCSHVLHQDCFHDTIRRKYGDAGECPLCRARWFDTEQDIAFAEAVRASVLVMERGVYIKLPRVTGARISVDSPMLELSVQIAAYAALRRGQSIAASEDGKAIISGMMHAVGGMHGRSIRAEVMRECLPSRAVAEMRLKDGDPRLYTDEMSDFAWRVAAEGVNHYAHTQGAMD